MHIVEVDEHLDYKKYWTFPPDVHDITLAAGRRMWREWQGMADSYPCPPCKPGAQAIAYGSETMIGLLIGKKNAPKYPAKFEELHEMMDAAWKKYSAKHCTGGKCVK